MKDSKITIRRNSDNKQIDLTNEDLVKYVNKHLPPYLVRVEENGVELFVEEIAENQPSVYKYGKVGVVLPMEDDKLERLAEWSLAMTITVKTFRQSISIEYLK